jgi:hypothetical protein
MFNKQLSPAYFDWVRRAVDKYYRFDSNQRQLQQYLLSSIRRRIKEYKQSVRRIHNISNTVSENDLNFRSHYLNSQLTELFDLSDIASSLAGLPIMNGLCLQKQKLDPMRSSFPLHIKSGQRPFLFSLVGSWGPVFFPAMWQSFREWMIWRVETDNLFHPLLEETLVTNFYFRNNHDIWTPYFIK